MFVLAEKHTSKVIGHTFAFSLLVVCGLFTTKGIVFPCTLRSLACDNEDRMNMAA